MPIQLSGSLVITGSITTTGVITMSGSIASASYSSTSDLLQGTGSVGFTTTASFNAVSSSQQQISASYIALSASYNTFSGSASTRITVDSASLLQVSSSQQQISASLLNVIAIGATTGSNSFRANQSITGSLVVSSTITAQTLIVQTVTSSIVYSSGSNIFGCDLNSRQTFTGSVLITGSLTIAGASSATSYSGTTIFGSTIACSPIGCFATSCATSFIGGTGTLSGDLTLQGAVTRNIKFLDNTNTNLNAQIQYDQISSTSGQLLFGTNNAGTFATRLTITSGGSVGIGATTINSLLSLNSTAVYYIDFQQSGTSKGLIGVPFSANQLVGGSASGDLVIRNTSRNTIFTNDSGNTAALTINCTNNIGIGTTTPSAEKLSVYGDMYVQTNFTIDGKITGGGGIASKMDIYASSNTLGTGCIKFYTANVNRMTIDPSGNIGAPTGANIYSASDIRLKKNITTITNGLSKINALNPVKFNWIDGFVESEEGKDMLGFIAQEVQNIVPEAVESFSSNSIIVGETTIETPLRVNEKFIIPVLVKAMQEQQCTICTQASRITLLESCLGIA